MSENEDEMSAYGHEADHELAERDMIQFNDTDSDSDDDDAEEVEVEADEREVSVSVYQNEYIAEIKDLFGKNVVNHKKGDQNYSIIMPTHFEPNTNPNVNKLQLYKNIIVKVVVAVCPHQQFDIAIFKSHFKCKCGTNNLRLKGWNSHAAVICDISASKYMIEYRYLCSKNNCPNSTKPMTLFSTDEFGKNRISCPDSFRSLYRIGLITHKNRYTKEFVSLVVNDVTTNKSIYQIGESIEHFRTDEYYRLRVAYEGFLRLKSSEGSITDFVTSSSRNECVEFSTMDDDQGYNDRIRPAQKTLIAVYSAIIDQNEDLIKTCLANIPGFPAVSMDTTYNVAKRTIVTNSKTKQQSPRSNKCWFTVMSGLNQIVYCQEAQGETLDVICASLDQLMKKEVKPSYICVDNCCQVSKGIKSYYAKHGLEEPTISLDVKHLINRLVKQCNNKCTLYAEFSKDIHAAIVGTERKVVNIGGKVKRIKPPLDPGEEIWDRLSEKVEQYRKVNAANITAKIPNYDSLFLKEFNSTFDEQEYHVLHCLHDYIDDDNKHYFETGRKPGEINYYRGTNKNESMHRSLNSMWPVKCGVNFARRLLLGFIFNYNFKRAIPTAKIDGYYPGCIRVSNLNDLLCLDTSRGANFFNRSYWSDIVNNKARVKTKYSTSVHQKKNSKDNSSHKAVHRGVMDSRQTAIAAAERENKAERLILQAAKLAGIEGAKQSLVQLGIVGNNKRKRDDSLSINSSLRATKNRKISWSREVGGVLLSVLKGDPSLRNDWSNKVVPLFVEKCNEAGISDYDYFMENDERKQAVKFLREKYKYLSKSSREVVPEVLNVTTESMDNNDHVPGIIPATSSQVAPTSLPTLPKPPTKGSKNITLTATEVEFLKHAINRWNNTGNNKIYKFNWETISHLYTNKCRLELATNNDLLVYERTSINLSQYWKDNSHKHKTFCTSLNRKNT